VGRRLFKRAEKKLHELLKDVPDEYLDLALRRLGEQLNATKKIWDMNAKCLIDIPDEKIRQDAALAILAYKWGKPVERNVNLNTNVKDFPAMLAELAASSPAFQEAEAEMSSQKALEGHQSAPALPGPHQTKQHKLDGPPCGCAGPDRK